MLDEPKKKWPPKWYDVYENEEESKFFLVLSKGKFKWASVAALAKDCNLTKRRIEEILEKYHKIGMVFQSEQNEENWAYWERAPELVPAIKLSIADEDKLRRIKNILNKEK